VFGVAAAVSPDCGGGATLGITLHRGNRCKMTRQEDYKPSLKRAVEEAKLSAKQDSLTASQYNEGIVITAGIGHMRQTYYTDEA
jgi:hypothetical protein